MATMKSANIGLYGGIRATGKGLCDGGFDGGVSVRVKP